MTKTWRLKRTTQCAKCPWRKDVDPREIPNGYSQAKHQALCHEADDAHCVGWLVNQIELGNNIPLRMHMMSCANANRITLQGEQHETFADTLPRMDKESA